MGDSQRHRCAVCGRSDVRLYRYYGSFLRDSEIFCDLDAPEKSGDWLVPLCEDTDGSVWGYSSIPEDALARFYAMSDASVLLITERGR